MTTLNDNKTNDKWACPHCTFRNDVSDNSCQVCYAQRLMAPSLPTPSAPCSTESSDSFSISSISQTQTPGSSRTAPSSPSVFRIAFGGFIGGVLGGVVGAMSASINNRSLFSGLMEGAWTGASAGAGLAAFNEMAQRNGQYDPRQLDRRPYVPRTASGGGRLYVGPGVVVSFGSQNSPPMILQRYSRAQGWELDTERMSHEELISRFGVGMENKGASTSTIESLPTYVYDAKQQIPTVPSKKGTSDTPQSPKNPTCVICLDDFSSGDELRTLPCFHSFHKPCIDRWLQTNATCPICKHEVR